jgi:hypothetical protein
MNSYVFGDLRGELPTHLLGAGEPGERVRALAPLQGTGHNLFAAIEAGSAESLARHLTSLEEAGASLGSPFTACDSVPCQALTPAIGWEPSWIAPKPELVFAELTAEGELSVLAEIVEALGSDAVAAVTDGAGGFLVELTGHDRAAVASALDRLVSSANVSHSVVHWADGTALRRA